MVFQRFDLFPHMTALQNVTEAPVRMKRLPAESRVRRTARSPHPGFPL
jgi:polar amino acid transport system ATP-binding protein